MKLCIDWEAVHQDWLASGLSKNRYFLSGRIEKFIREGIAPCYSTFLRHLRVLEKGQAISQESLACVSTPDQNNNTVAVHRLTPADIRKATASAATIGTRAPMPRNSLHSRLWLWAGGFHESRSQRLSHPLGLQSYRYALRLSHPQCDCFFVPAAGRCRREGLCGVCVGQTDTLQSHLG